MQKYAAETCSLVDLNFFNINILLYHVVIIA